LGRGDRANYDNDFWEFCDNDDDDHAGFELLPDHEYPEATAMWRDTFG
jgi:hypothetical protein